MIGQEVGHLLVIRLESKEGEPEVYRCGCHLCGTDCCLASGTALRMGTADRCFDCRRLSEMTPREKALAAFKKKLDLSPEPAVLDAVA